MKAGDAHDASAQEHEARARALDRLWSALDHAAAFPPRDLSEHPYAGEATDQLAAACGPEDRERLLASKVKRFDRSDFEDGDPDLGGLSMMEENWALAWVFERWSPLWHRVSAAGAIGPTRDTTFTDPIHLKLHAVFVGFLERPTLDDPGKREVATRVLVVLREAEPFRSRLPAYFVSLKTALMRDLLRSQLHAGHRNLVTVWTWARSESIPASTPKNIRAAWADCPAVRGIACPDAASLKRYMSTLRKLGMLPRASGPDRGRRT